MRAPHDGRLAVPAGTRRWVEHMTDKQLVICRQDWSCDQIRPWVMRRASDLDRLGLGESVTGLRAPPSIRLHLLLRRVRFDAAVGLRLHWQACF